MKEFKEAARGHLEQLDRLIDRGSVPNLKKLYEQAISELETKLGGMIKNGAAPFSIQQAQSLLAQARHGLIRTSIEMGTALGKQTAITSQASAKALVASIKRMEKAASGAVIQLPIEQASKFAGVVDKRKTSLLALNKKSMARYGAAVVGKVEQAMAMSLLKGEAGYAAVKRVADTMGDEWWKAERIVRTETAYAFNATHADAIGETTKSFPDMMMRWVEYVSDVTLVPFDDRVGDDSVALHGQLTRPGGFFVMPSVHPKPPMKISPSLKGQSWQHPPNRPHDRAVLQPWRPGWGWGWIMSGGQRVEKK